MTPDQLIKAALDMAAKAIDKRCDDYVRECGTYDHTTGVTEYPGNGEEWVEEWVECAAAIRAITPADVLAKVGAVKSPAPDATTQAEPGREVDVLRAENERLRAALKGMDLEAQRETVEALLKPTLIHLVMKMSDDARAALAQKDDKP